jgi:hypothetical protein
MPTPNDPVHELVNIIDCNKMRGVNNTKKSTRRVLFLVFFFLIKNFTTVMVPCVAEHRIVDHFQQFASPHKVL